MEKRPGILLLALVMLVNWMLPAGAAAAGQNVQVHLPAFKVSLNGVGIDNRYSQYPLIVYKDITYFPMTYYDCRFLGLESAWDNNRGLTIVKTDVNWGYHQYESAIRNAPTHGAQLASFKITVNGQAIDNSVEAYPLLLFRNVTYFPITWRFAVEEFGWQYSFTPNNGLVIHSSANTTSVAQLTLPIVNNDLGGKGAFTMAGDFFYYEGANGKIYQAPASNPDNRKEVYQLPPTDVSTGFGHNFVSLQTDNGRAILKYHTGGATMGSDHLIWLKEDGSAEEIDSGYAALKIYDDYTIRVEQRFSFAVNNLQIRRRGETQYINVGDPACSFGIFIYEDDNSRSGKPSSDLYLIDDHIYVLGFYGYYQNSRTLDTTGLYRVNINTNETVRLCSEEVAGFEVVNDKIFFIDRQQRLYRVPLTGGQAELMVEKAVDQFEVLQGKVYFSLAQDKQLFAMGSQEPINPGGRLNKLEIQNGYLVALFDKDSPSPYKMIVINKDGKVLYKTIENVLLVRIQNGKIAFVKDN